MKSTHITKYTTCKTFKCSPNRFGQVMLTSYGRAHMESGESIEIENPDFKGWKAKGLEMGYISAKLERYPLELVK